MQFRVDKDLPRCSWQMWYDNRVKVGNRLVKTYDWDDLPFGEFRSPRDIYAYLDRFVWKQDAAKRAAALIAYNCFYRGIRSHNLFIGPTGCGKSYIWRCLRLAFPGRIAIVDGSNVTNEGWKGDKKWSDLFCDPIFQTHHPTILVIDEADKMFMPRHTSDGDNVSHAIQSEGLCIMDGIELSVGRRNSGNKVHTVRVSCIFLGAFSSKAEEMAKSSRSIGFNGSVEPSIPYGRAFVEEDIVKYGVMPEILGRMQRIVNLEPMMEQDYRNILDSSCSPVFDIERQYGVSIKLSSDKKNELATEAFQKGLGIRGMRHRVCELLDDVMFDDCCRQEFSF